MTKAEFIRKFADDNDTTYTAAEQWCNAFFKQLAKEIVDNKRLEIRGLGIWSHRKYRGRTATDFLTKEKIKLDDSIGVRFKLSETLSREMREIYLENKEN